MASKNGSFDIGSNNEPSNQFDDFIDDGTPQKSITITNDQNEGESTEPGKLCDNLIQMRKLH